MLIFPFLMVRHRTNPVDTGRQLDVRKTFRRRPGRLLNVFCTFSLRPVSTGKLYESVGIYLHFGIIH